MRSTTKRVAHAINGISAGEGLILAGWQANDFLTDVRGGEYVAAYNREVVLRDDFAGLTDVQAFIDQINASVTALNKIFGASGGDTSGLAKADFDAVLHLDNFIPALEAEYLFELAGSAITSLDNLNALIANTNNEQGLLVLVNKIDSDNLLSPENWQINNVLNGVNAADASYIAAYNDEAQVRKPFDDVASIQRLIDDVNASVNAMRDIADAAVAKCRGINSALVFADFAFRSISGA